METLELYSIRYILLLRLFSLIISDHDQMYKESLISAKQFFQIKSHVFILVTTQHTFCVKKCCQILSLNLKKCSFSLVYKLLHSKHILHSLAKLTYSNKA